MTESGPTAAVPKDPKPAVERVESLARRVITADILLPKFQRDFVWERGQVIDLLDSIAKNFPIGSVLLWQSRQELRSENDIAGLEIDLPRPDYPVNYLLDGQQRLSVICGALFWGGDDPKSIWNLAFDLRSGEFFHLDSMDDTPPHIIRTNRLSDPSRFYKQVGAIDAMEIEDKDILKSNADQLFNRFKDYLVAVVTLGDMSIEDVAPIFERINSTGTPLTIVDLMRAATWSTDFDLIDAIDGVKKSLSLKSFDGVDRKVILRNLSAAAGGGFSADSIDGLRNYDADKLSSAVGAIDSAYRLAVDFLSTEIGIPTDAIVPYANQLVVLSELFRLLPNPSAAQIQIIKQWFWKTSISGYFSGWNTGNMSSDHAAVTKFASEGTGEIDVSVSKVGADIWLSRQYRSNGAHAKTLGIVLAHLSPLDLLTGTKIDVSSSLAWQNAKEYHHFFPRDYLKLKGVKSRDANCLANIVMLTSSSNKTISNRAPSEYLQQVEDEVGDGLACILSSNLISAQAYSLAKLDDYYGFVRQRSEDIDRHVSKLAGWES